MFFFFGKEKRSSGDQRFWSDFIGTRDFGDIIVVLWEGRWGVVVFEASRGRGFLWKDFGERKIEADRMTHSSDWCSFF